jgi:hypothetical protein
MQVSCRHSLNPYIPLPWTLQAIAVSVNVIEMGEAGVFVFYHAVRLSRSSSCMVSPIILPFVYLVYVRLLAISTVKQHERQDRIRNLAPRYHEPLGITDTRILNRSAAELVAGVRAGRLEPQDILTAYKKALKAHAVTNCLTEIMISAAESWAADCNKQGPGPLAGIPISLKDVSD